MYTISEQNNYINPLDNLRYVLVRNIYCDSTIEELSGLIEECVPCLSIEFDQSDLAFNVKIKKTAMRKLLGFSHNPLYYYPLVANAFMKFIDNNKEKVIEALESISDNPDIKLYVDNIGPMDIIPLYTITCISSNIFRIKL